MAGAFFELFGFSFSVFYPPCLCMCVCVYLESPTINCQVFFRWPFLQHTKFQQRKNVINDALRILFISETKMNEQITKYRILNHVFSAIIIKAKSLRIYNYFFFFKQILFSRSRFFFIFGNQRNDKYVCLLHF